MTSQSSEKLFSASQVDKYGAMYLGGGGGTFGRQSFNCVSALK